MLTLSSSALLLTLNFNPLLVEQAATPTPIEPASPAGPQAETPPPDEGSDETRDDTGVPSNDPHDARLSPEQIRRINQRWSGIGIGYDNGLWGGGYGQSLKLSIPFGRKLGRFMGLRVRSVFAHHNDAFNNQFDPVVNLGGELFGRGPVWNGMLRVYGGGGLWAGIRPNPTSVGSKVALGGGGHFGLEVMAAPCMSFTFEIGGQAPGHDLGHDGGASAMGGMMFYFGRIKD